MDEALKFLTDYLEEAGEAGEKIVEGGGSTSTSESDVIPGSPNVDMSMPDATQDAINEEAAKAKNAAGGKIFGNVVPSLKDVPYPTGSIGVLLFLCLLVIFAITPAPGQDVTRLQLIWKAMLGGATLGGQAQNPTIKVPSPAQQWSNNPAPGNSAVGNIHGGWGAQWGGGFY